MNSTRSEAARTVTLLKTGKRPSRRFSKTTAKASQTGSQSPGNLKQVEPKPEAKLANLNQAEPPADLKLHIVKRVHELYEELGREDVREVEEWEKAERETREHEPHK